MKKLIVGLMLLLTGVNAYAGTWGSGPGAQPVTYTSSHVIGDGSTAQGGTAPAYSLEPADISDGLTLSEWTTTSAVNRTDEGQAKFRTQCTVNHVLPDDPIVFPGQPGLSHLHEFFGNTLANANSTYSSLRTTGGSTCGGGPLNRTAYWFPAVERVKSSGVTVVYKPDIISIYYFTNLNDPHYPAQVRFPRGFNYIGGVNPADGNNVKMQNALTAAGSGYVINGRTTPDFTNWGTGFVGWSCVSTDLSTTINGSNAYSPIPGNATQPYLQDANGHATLTCPAGPGVLEADIDAPACWDGHNLQSPDGRSHVMYKIHWNSDGQDYCPDHWFYLPTFEGKFFFSYKDPSEVGNMFLSSDVMDYGAPDPTSVSPCRQVSHHYCHGETFHFDWFGAWNYGTGTSPGIMIRWMNHCAGVHINLDGVDFPSDGLTCDYSTIDSTTRMLTDTATPDSTLAPPDPTGDIANVYNYAGGLEKNRYFPITPGTVLDLHDMSHMNN